MNDDKRELIQTKLDLVEQNSETYAIDLSVPSGWLGYLDGVWYIVSYSHRRRPRIEGNTYDSRTEMMDFLENQPTEIVLREDCGVCNGASIWQYVQEQSVGDNSVERCHWCPETDENRSISLFETVEDGTVPLCPDCKSLWKDQNEIIEPVEP
jgi:hypothetical protein